MKSKYVKLVLISGSLGTTLQLVVPICHWMGCTRIANVVIFPGMYLVGRAVGGFIDSWTGFEWALIFIINAFIYSIAIFAVLFLMRRGKSASSAKYA